MSFIQPKILFDRLLLSVWLQGLHVCRKILPAQSPADSFDLIKSIIMKQLVAICLLFTLFTSCVTSIHPLSENGTGVVKDERLPGHWMDSASRMEVWVSAAGSAENKDLHYNITVYEPNKDKDHYKDTSFLQGQLVKLDNEYFLDLSIADDNPQSVNAGRTIMGFLLPMHQFFKLHISGNSIALLYMDHDKLKRLVNGATAHFEFDANTLVLTGASGALQANMKSWSKNPELFQQAFLFRKMKP